MARNSNPNGRYSLLTDEQRERQLAKAREYKKNNAEKIKADRAKYYSENKTREREMTKEWLTRNSDEKNERNRRYREKNGDKIRAHRSTTQYKDTRNTRARARYKNDASYAIGKLLRASLTQALRLGSASKSASVVKLLGCSVPELMVHLEKQFGEGMTWDNRGEWHIDHIRPCASFDLTDPDQQRACFHYTNLQPLWGVENQRKGAKWIPLDSSAIIP